MIGYLSGKVKFLKEECCMAETVKSGVTLNFVIPLTNSSGAAAERSVTIDTDAVSLTPAIKDTALEFAGVIEQYPALLQPTGWRDDDTAESAWSIAGGSGAVIAKAIYKQEVTFDRTT